MPELLEQDKVDPFILPNGEKLSSLLYADDLIILSQTASGLQNCLQILSESCSKWGLNVNMKKTKVIIFQKKTRRATQFNFIYNNHPLEIVTEYTYLGMTISASGSFQKAVETLREKMKRALAAVRKQLVLSKLPVNIANKIFESFLPPILTYGSEVWGAYEKNDYDSWDRTSVEKGSTFVFL